MFISLNSTCGVFINLSDVKYFFIGANRMDFTFKDGEDLTIFYEETEPFEKDKERITCSLISPCDEKAAEQRQAPQELKEGSLLNMDIDEMFREHFMVHKKHHHDYGTMTYARLKSAIKKEGVKTVGDLFKNYSKRTIMQIPGLGKKSWTMLFWYFERMGINLRPF